MEPPGTKWETGVAWLPLGNFWGMLEFVKGSLLRGKRPLRGESTVPPLFTSSSTLGLEGIFWY